MKNSWLFIHGGWGGSWQWTPIQRHLKNININSIAPMMPGMGLKNGDHITLDDFIEHASKFITDQKQQINIAAFSFGGMTATALAGKFSEKINKLVYIDAFVPLPGQSFTDIVGEKISKQINSYSDVLGENNMIPPFFETDSRYCNQPLNTLFTKVNYSEETLLSLDPVYIECTKKDPHWTFTPIFEKTVKNLKKKNWKFESLPSDHMPMYSHTEELCKLLF